MEEHITEKLNNENNDIYDLISHCENDEELKVVFDSIRNNKKLIEKSISKRCFEREKEQTDYINKLVWSDTLVNEQRRTDIAIIQEQLILWHGKAKNNEQKDKLINLIKCLWRIDSFYNTVDTALKKAIAEIRDLNRKDLFWQSELKKKSEEITNLESEIDKLKKQIEFHEKAT